MTRKKSKTAVTSPELDASSHGSTSIIKSPPQNTTPPTAKANASEPSTSALVICRNKHWRYISSFHGPWLQLPPEVLESLAYSNFYSPRPQPIDPAVFFDLCKIRRLVEDATNLAVRAANGTTSSSLSNSMNASNGLLGGGSAAALGLGLGGGGNAKLSKERKHRMREHATQKLSHAYHLDEIAASVATMQSASALEDVAKFVLQRNPNDSDAKYVHFFHEKIPSRSLAECTSLEPLDEVISQMPTEGAPYRTRAVTKIFKEDFLGATRDLTEGLSVCRLYNAQHQIKNAQNELMTAQDAAALSREYRADAKVAEKDQPSSLECQLLFHRAGTYLTLACDHIAPALHSVAPVNDMPTTSLDQEEGQSPKLSPAAKEARHAALEARKMVRTYAKRALRDYVSFLSHFDYTPGLSPELTETFLQPLNAAANGYNKRDRYERHLNATGHSRRDRTSSNALVLRGDDDGDVSDTENANGSNELPPSPPKTRVHPLNNLFAAVPPADLPPYPGESTALVAAKDTQARATSSHHDISEAITYHPLLTDALHSLLLCHCLVQTSPKEHLRHAHMVARLARVCDGYPIFLAARSPARADWIEVVRRANNWLSLGASWEVLCEPAPLPGQKEKKPESSEERKERSKREAIRDALADDRVHDEESFRASVRAREMRAAREEEEEQRREYLRTRPHIVDGETTGASEKENGSSPKRWAQEDGKEYPIGTERADAIARWIREAPAPGGGGGEGRSKKTGKKGRLRKEASDQSTVSGLEQSVESLNIDE